MMFRGCVLFDERRVSRTDPSAGDKDAMRFDVVELSVFEGRTTVCDWFLTREEIFSIFAGIKFSGAIVVGRFKRA